MIGATMDTVCEEWCSGLAIEVRTTELQDADGVRWLQLVVSTDMLLCDLGLDGERAVLEKAVGKRCIAIVCME